MGLRKKPLLKIRISTRFGSKQHIIIKNKYLKGDCEILLLLDFTGKVIFKKLDFFEKNVIFLGWVWEKKKSLKKPN